MSLPKNSILLRYLPLNYSQIYNTGNDGGQSDSGGQTAGAEGGGGGLSADQLTGTPRRSLSQTILSQINSPTTGFGLTGRSPSPSPFMSSHALSRKSSFNRNNFMSRGPSLQSLVKSFINRVSRGTQTDCDDNFDLVSIASVTSGFSAIASDLSQSRLKLFLNDGAQSPNHHLHHQQQQQLHSGNSTRQTKSYASSQVDDNEFVEELQKLRDEINGEFGSDQQQTSEQYTANQFDMEDLSEEPLSVLEKQSESEQFSEKVSARLAAAPKVVTIDAEMITDAVQTRDSYTQTEPLKKVQTAEKAVETEPEPEKPAVAEAETVAIPTQTSAPTTPEKPKPQTRECETQTEEVKFCDHSCDLSKVPNGNVGNYKEAPSPQPPPQPAQAPPQPMTIIVQQPAPQPPQIMKCEFLISHADIICKENKVIRNRSGSSSTENASGSPSPPVKAASAQVNTVLENGHSQQKLNSAAATAAAADPKHETEAEKSFPPKDLKKGEEAIEKSEKQLVELKVDDLQTPANGHQVNGNNNNSNGNNSPAKESVGQSPSLKPTTTNTILLSVANGVPEKNKEKESDKKSKKKKEKEASKKTPKKSPRKVLAIIPGSDDEEREKGHQAALAHVRPKCCTIS
ncbi:hypothetical protein TYRP_001407 [Tyrophagus putrescentiae]|nr:hypothetical protein TYRP_001407 [Tyrophagus putrescentiae]